MDEALFFSAEIYKKLIRLKGQTFEILFQLSRQYFFVEARVKFKAIKETLL
jgi:hypothetical protein